MSPSFFLLDIANLNAVHFLCRSFSLVFDADQRDCPASNVNLVCSAVNLMANCSVQGGCEFDGVVCGVVNLMARDLLGNMLVLSAAVNYLTMAPIFHVHAPHTHYAQTQFWTSLTKPTSILLPISASLLWRGPVLYYTPDISMQPLHLRTKTQF